MSVSKRTRFEVFKRDGFRCVYCGATPMSSLLQADHVVPVSGGGTDAIINLVTSCSACNAGKSNVPLSSVPPAAPNADSMMEHAEQVRRYLLSQKALAKTLNDVSSFVLSEIEKRTSFPFYASDEALIESYARTFPSTELIDAFCLAYRKFGNGRRAIKYFCGIVRRWKETGKVTLSLPPKTNTDKPEGVF